MQLNFEPSRWFSISSRVAPRWASGQVITTRSMSGIARAFSSTWMSSGLPPSRRNCFGTGRPMRRPTPPASTIIPVVIQPPRAAAHHSPLPLRPVCPIALAPERRATRPPLDSRGEDPAGDRTGAGTPGERMTAGSRASRLQVRVRLVAVRTGFLLGRLRPLRPHVVLATTRSARLGGNLRAIAEELARRHPPVPARALATPIGPGLRGRIRALRDAVVAGWHLATARVFVVDDYYFPMYGIRPRPGTVRVQTWHAAGALKKVGYSVLDKRFGAD